MGDDKRGTRNAAARAARSEAELRANLKKRKEQARARSRTDGVDAAPASEEPSDSGREELA
jgi:hypothetical protein